MVVRQNEDGSRVVIGFRHVTEGRNKGTKCWIYRQVPNMPELKEVLAEGHTRCSRKDRFSKETGRLIALNRAVDKIDDREFRTQIWQAYWNRGNNG